MSRSSSTSTPSVRMTTIGGKRYVLVEPTEFKRLTSGRRAQKESKLPPLPKPDANGNVPAIAHMRAQLARRLIHARRRAKLTQAELARRAGVRPETISRLESGKQTPDEATFAKIEKALSQ